VLLDPTNWDNAPFGLSGAVADRQHVGGFRGVNRALLDEAVRRSQVVPREGTAFQGPSISAALTGSIDPFLPGLSDRPDATERFLKELGIDPAIPPEKLSEEESERLLAAVAERMTGRGVRPEFVAMLGRERYFLPTMGMDAEELSDLQNATGREGIPSVGVALALGDLPALGRAKAAHGAWKTGILRGLRRLEEGQINATQALQWFVSPEMTLAGTQAGLAMSYLLDPTKPVLVFSESDGPTRVSGRGTMWLVEQGLDLSQALREAAQAVGGEGGGHRVASGATIPREARPRFLEIVDGIVHEQLRARASGGAA
jgi:hypothetical protein